MANNDPNELTTGELLLTAASIFELNCDELFDDPAEGRKLIRAMRTRAKGMPGDKPLVLPVSD